MQSKEFYTSQLDLQSEILLSFLWSKDQRNENNQAEESATYLYSNIRVRRVPPFDLVIITKIPHQYYKLNANYISLISVIREYMRVNDRFYTGHGEAYNFLFFL